MKPAILILLIAISHTSIYSKGLLPEDGGTSFHAIDASGVLPNAAGKGVKRSSGPSVPIADAIPRHEISGKF